MPENNFSQPTKWWWVRHAPVVDAHPMVRISGQLDVGADVSAPESIKSLKWLAATLPIDAQWVTSNLIRTRQTADAIISAGINAGEIKTDERLNEQDFGNWAGMTWDELGTADDNAAKQFWDAPATTAPPNGESFADLMARVAQAIDDLTKQHSGRDIICVAHAGTIRAALAHGLGLGPEKALSFNVGNLSLTRIDNISDGLKLKRGGHWRIAGVNIIG
ncbi:MAG: histidine phosphatase family protein [Rhodospirillaceae bacterium]|nr:histidine phosphatase family protein [Rhodospirillaceae bacterium]